MLLLQSACVSLSVALLACGAALGQTSYPMVTKLTPTALQRGQEAVFTIDGNGSFAGSSSLLFDDPGLSGIIVTDEKPAKSAKGVTKTKTTGLGRDSVKVRIKASKATRLGPREVRIATEQGVSSIGVLVVVDHPVVAEADETRNDSPEKAQVVSFPAVVSGAISKAEDVDWYAVDVKAGQILTFAVWGNRIENKIHDLQTHLDPILLLHDDKGREIAANDNQEFADPTFSHKFNSAGRYLLQIRDVAYGGNANWSYVLHVTDGPFVSAVFPTAVKAGATAELEAVGVNLGSSKTIKAVIPAGLTDRPELFALDSGGKQTLPVPLVVTSLPIAIEKADAADSGGQELAFPSALCGRFGESNDVDGYRFQAKKGEGFVFEVVSRRAGSAADPILRILNSKGATVTEVDDTIGKDPRIDWTSPADGVYTLQLNDLHSRGGPGFGYVIEAKRSVPDFEVTSDPDKLNLGPGAKTPVFVKVERRGGFDGPVGFKLEGMTAGLTASPLTVAKGLTEGVIVVSASADAKPATASLATIKASATVNGKPLERDAVPNQEIYLPGGGRGVLKVETLAIGVSKPSDITLSASKREVVLKPGEKVEIEVDVKRNADYTQGVNLSIPLAHLGRNYANPLPPGVTMVESGSKTLLGPKETRGKIVLLAGADAKPVEKAPITIMGHVSINFVVKTAYCTEPILITVKAK